MNNFRELNVWNKAVELATIIYKMTDSYPKSERYGLTSQIRRSTVSYVQILQRGQEEDQRETFVDFWMLLQVLVMSLKHNY